MCGIAGGINLESCRDALIKEAEKENINLNIALIHGDNIIDRQDEFIKKEILDFETGSPLPKNILSMNAYLGAIPIKEALKEAPYIIITGRCVDSALVLGSLMYEYNWKKNDYDLLASGSLAGHIIECGAQCTGGNFTVWHLIDGFDNMGFPIVEVRSNGDFIVSTPKDTGGLVSFGTVAEQFLYEIGDPKSYILPDVVCNFSDVKIKDIGKNKVFVSGAKGLPPTSTYKVSATYMDGYSIVATLVIGGKNAYKKSKIISEAIINKTNRILFNKNFEKIRQHSLSTLGTDSIYGPDKYNKNSREVVLRLMARHEKKEALVILSKEVAQAATGMASGVMNYLGGRPSVSKSIRLHSYLIPKSNFSIEIDCHGKKYSVDIPLDGVFQYEEKDNKMIYEELETDTSVPLFKLAFARSGDKGDHANIGVIARKADYLPYVRNGLKLNIINKYFSHLLKGEIYIWDVPGIYGLNILLKRSLGGGGMSSLRIDPQGKAYAQQLLEIPIPVNKKLIAQLD